MPTTLVPLLMLTLLLASCTAAQIRIAPKDDADAFRDLKASFESRNPGYEIDRVTTDTFGKVEGPHVVFIQSGPTRGRVLDMMSEFTVGDIVLLRKGESLHLADETELVVFRTPEPFGSLPTVIRPDWDEQITDTPGGCATEEGAYRRICLTWLEEKSPYTYHALNAHRVRITDSFTHYHPLEGGFDEFYLVQMSNDHDALLTSERTIEIVAEDVDSTEGLLTRHDLEVGDLVYLPRGTIHRGVGGVLAHVITIPGFKPGAEIGVDHHLRAINERLGLEGDEALPLNAEASTGPVIR